MIDYSGAHDVNAHGLSGSAGFFIDLAVVDADRPGRYLLGIECDGATYHSARSARGRDRLRQAVLEGLNWRIHRIWSTDWFRNPDREFQKTVFAIEEAKAQPSRSAIQALSPTNTVAPEPVVRGEPIGNKVLPIESRKASDRVPNYESAQIRVNLQSELHLADIGDLTRCLSQVVAVESPVHWMEAARRVANAAGVQRLGSRIQDAFERACRSGSRAGLFAMRKDFLWRPDQSQPTIRDRSELSASAKKIEYVAPEEIAAAIERVVRESYGIEPEEVATSVCRLLGFGRAERLKRCEQWSRNTGRAAGLGWPNRKRDHIALPAGK